MPDKNTPSLPFESGDANEQKLWAALAGLPRTEPSTRLRQGFYDQLEHAGAEHWSGRLRKWLGLGSNSGWLTAAACVLLGFGTAQLLGEPRAPESDRLAALEQSVATLNRELVLDRLRADAPGTRLQGVYQASGFAQDDAEIVQALLQRATQDRAASVRSAAIDALGPQLGSAAVGNELMDLLEHTDSPIVQLALVDLVLRNGNRQQLALLVKLADEQRLHPDLATHVQNSIRSDAI